jgi:hypothetical protein
MCPPWGIKTLVAHHGTLGSIGRSDEMKNMATLYQTDYHNSHAGGATNTGFVYEAGSV